MFERYLCANPLKQIGLYFVLLTSSKSVLLILHGTSCKPGGYRMTLIGLTWMIKKVRIYWIFWRDLVVMKVPQKLQGTIGKYFQNLNLERVILTYWFCTELRFINFLEPMYRILLLQDSHVMMHCTVLWNGTAVLWSCTLQNALKMEVSNWKWDRVQQMASRDT